MNKIQENVRYRGRCVIAGMAVALVGCVGSNARKPASVLAADVPGWAFTYPINAEEAATIVQAAAVAATWRPVSLEGTPQGTLLFDTKTGWAGVGIFARVRIAPVDAQHTSVNVYAVRKNDAQPGDCSYCAEERFLSELHALVAMTISSKAGASKP